MSGHRGAPSGEAQVALDSASIVVRGFFQPAVFNPNWFRELELVGADEFHDSEIEMISPEFSKFRLGWLNFRCARDSIQLQTEQVDEFPRLRDAAIGTLRALHGYPVSVLGINRENHTMVDSFADLHRLGDALTPKDPWTGFLKVPGVRSIAMWGARTDGWRGRVNVRVEPSVSFHPAAFVGVNDHFELEPDENDLSDRANSYGSGDAAVEATAAKLPAAIEVLTNEWDTSMARAADAHAQLMALAIAVERA